MTTITNILRTTSQVVDVLASWIEYSERTTISGRLIYLHIYYVEEEERQTSIPT